MRHPLFHFFSSFSLFGRFFFDFFILQAKLHISVFYRFIWFHYNFSVFMVLIFFSRSHVFYPLFHLSGLPFSFFVNNLTFSLLSTFFISSLRFYPSSPFHTIFLPFTAFHCLSLPFLFFSPMSILHFPLFSRFLPFLNSFLSFLLFPPLPSFYTLFLPFF